MKFPSSTPTTSVRITLALAADIVARLSRVAAQTGQTLETLLVGLAEKAAQDANDTSGQAEVPLWKKSAEERVAAWRRWCARHRPVNHFVDDSRASIYAGRGE